MIDGDRRILLIMSRFSIAFGFGDCTVDEVCDDNGVDRSTFLAVANLVCGKGVADGTEISLPPLVGYLKKAHTYFLELYLPSIRRKLIEAVNSSDVNDVAFLIVKYFDDYAVEVRRHMEYENDVLFAYVSKLLAGEKSGRFSLQRYSVSHTDISERLNELKDIIVRHYRQQNNDMLASALYDIIDCQDDLESHCRVENVLLVPAVRRLEVEVKPVDGRSESPDRPTNDAEEQMHGLSEREKEVIVCVARGKSNKEIADELCLSVNTVTTHRRNIAAKLQIHSQAGLAIFAILHKLIDITEIKL